MHPPAVLGLPSDIVSSASDDGSDALDVHDDVTASCHRRGGLRPPAALGLPTDDSNPSPVTPPAEQLLQRLPAAAADPESETPISMNWDLIWPSMSGELVAPPAESGVRITMSPTRQHLESTRFGIYFHSLMENLPRDLQPLTIEQMRAIAFAQGEAVADVAFLDQLVEDGKRLHDIFLNGDLYTNLKSARRRLNELPYMYGSDNIHTKRPDLILEDQSGKWHIVDYKTDFVQVADIPALLQKHSAQLSEYINDLHHLTGLVFTPWVYFAQLGKLVEASNTTALGSPVPVVR